MRTVRGLAVVVILLSAVGWAGPAAAATPAAATPAPATAPAPATVPQHRAATPVEHFIFLMQGERTFDNYFGTYPGADGHPVDACQSLVLGRTDTGCVRPFSLHSTAVAPLAASRSVVSGQINGGRMDGFVAAFQRQGRDGTTAMGYYDDRDIPYYWNLAREYVLFDKFFSAVPYGIRLNRSYWVSAAAPPGGSEKVPPGGYGEQPTIFDRLTEAGVSWKFYVEDFDPQQSYLSASGADSATQTARVPLLNYRRFVQDRRLRSHIVDLDEYYRDLEQGTLPAVAYVASAGASERSARSLDSGQQLVRSMVTSLMMSRFWSSSAFMWSYDGSGGWFDHVPPQRLKGYATGLRVPAVLVSAYARRNHIDHTALDYTSALRFIEDNWRIPALTGRDKAATSLAGAFDFSSPPRPPHVLPSGPLPAAPKKAGSAVIYLMYGGAALAVVVFVLWAVGVPRTVRLGVAPVSRAMRASARLFADRPRRRQVPTA